jgi:conjugative transposon TraM protein
MNTKFNLRNTKYGLPIIILPFLILGAYVISDIFPPEDDKSVAETKSLGGINPNLPDPNLSKQKEKFLLLQELLNSRKKESGIRDLDEIIGQLENEEETQGESLLNPVTDSLLLNHLNEPDKNTEEALKALHHKYFPDEPEPGFLSTQMIQEERYPKNVQEEELRRMREQLAQMDSMLRAQNIEKEEKKEDEILVAKKSDEIKSSSFNTLTGEKKKMFISAILDEVQTVVDGSRIRIRLMDDIFIGDYLFKKGSYLYGLVSGFRAQRVEVSITSALYGDRILKTKLAIYDDDGIKGLYVPNSDFREMMRQAGGRMAQSSNVNINSSQSAYQQFISQMGQDFYRSVTQAVSTKIKQNKAKLKYASIIYLINEETQDDNI